MTNPRFPLSGEAQAFFGIRQERLVRFNGSWFTYESGGAYREIADEVIRAQVRQSVDWPLTPTNVSGVIDEIKSATVIDGHGAVVPLWLVPVDNMPDASALIVVKNGILEPVRGTLHAHDDRLFTFNALPFEYDPNAPTPNRWLQFLDEVFDGDVESMGELQKLFGYLLTSNTSLQKIFAVIGPTRSGKGTIGRVLEALIGKPNVCGPSFHKIGGDFGLQSFIGKQLALIADARLGHRTDKIIVAERLLSISGEDSLDIARKGIPDWHGRLNARIVIMSNELPALPDPSGALAARFVAFLTPNSFLGREDRTLTDKLLMEIPGILNWSLHGLLRLTIEGHIKTPAMARDLIDGIETLGSPVKAFVADRCRLSGEVVKDDLWSAYRGWHVSNGIPGAPLSKEMFGRALKTAFTGQVKDYRPRATEEEQRPRLWSGLSLRNMDHNPDQTASIIYGNPPPPFGPGVVPLRSR